MTLLLCSRSLFLTSFELRGKQLLDAKDLFLKRATMIPPRLRAMLGPYSVEGDTYVERLDYGFGNNFKAVKGHTILLKWKITGDTWHHSGLAKPLAITKADPSAYSLDSSLTGSAAAAL